MMMINRTKELASIFETTRVHIKSFVATKRVKSHLRFFRRELLCELLA